MKMKRLLAALLSAGMIFAFAACDNDTGSGDGTTKADGTTAEPSETTEEPNGENTPKPEAQNFNFGVIDFKEGTFKIPGGANALIGGNLTSDPTKNDEGFGAATAIRIAGFQGHVPPEDGFADDPESKFTTLISQQYDFWKLISKIEAEFYLDGVGGSTPDMIGNVELYFQGGRDAELHWDQGGKNLLEQTYDPDVEDDGFDWGRTMKAVWDFDAYAEKVGESYKNPLKESVEGNGNWGGGGVNKFGLMIQNDDTLDDAEGKILWTDVKIYVHDLEEYNEWVQKVEDEMGIKVSDNIEGRVIEVE